VPLTTDHTAIPNIPIIFPIRISVSEVDSGRLVSGKQGDLVRFAFWTIAGLIYVHFLFSYLLTAHVSFAALALFVLGSLYLIPAFRRRIARLPVLRWGWLRNTAFLLLITVANLLLASGNRADPERGALALVGATVITGQLGAPALDDAIVLVDAAGVIQSVGDASTPIPAGYRMIELKDRFLLPGLINAHGHLVLSGRRSGGISLIAIPGLADLFVGFLETYPGRRVALRLMERNVEHALRAGVTTLRGIGDPGYLDVAMRKRVESGASLGPRLLVAGPILAVSGGHGRQIGVEFDGPIEGRRAVREHLQEEVDLIKIASTGGVADSRRIGEAGELQMTPAELEAVIGEAHRKNVLVTAHIQSTQGVLEALQAGIDNIEHGAELDDQTLSLFLDNPRALRGFTSLHPTLSVTRSSRPSTEPPPANSMRYVMYVNGREISRRIRAGFLQALAAGVKIGTGTDAGMVPHADVWREMQLFSEIGGVSNERAIHMGTLATAESIGLEDLAGSVEVGKSADFVILERDPRKDLSAFATPELVIARGFEVQP